MCFRGVRVSCENSFLGRLWVQESGGGGRSDYG